MAIPPDASKSSLLYDEPIANNWHERLKGFPKLAKQVTFPAASHSGLLLMETMHKWFLAGILTAVTALAVPAGAQVREAYQFLDDRTSSPDNVYLPDTTPQPDLVTNTGGVHFSLDTSYLSHYMYRGIDQSTRPRRNENALQFDGRLKFELDNFPHPFVGVFANVFNTDPVSRFEEVRPYVGFEWTVRPITLAGGFNSYIFPNREGLDTQDVWMSLKIDDSRLFHSETPILSPYAYGAYDLEKYHGFYLEAGVRHDFPIYDTGLTLSAVGDFAFVAHDHYFRTPLTVGNVSGFQHYDGGMEATYDLTRLMNIPPRYGIWELKGYLFYTGSVDDRVRADNRLWGGVGINFKY